MPQAPLSVILLSMTVSKGPPEMVIPVPTGPAAALPAEGALGLLLATKTLWMTTQQERVPVIGLFLPCGQRPSCGAGGSPITWVLVSRPSWLSSNLEFSMTTVPPELVPEYPSALFSIHMWSM